MHLRLQQLPKFKLVVIGFFLVFVLFLVGGISALSLTVRVLFVLFLPGFSILQATVSDEFDFLERLILSPIVGIAFTSLLALYLSLLKISISEQTVIMSILLLSVPLLAYSWKRGGLRKTSFKSSTTPSTYFILILMVVISIVLISFPFPKNGILIPKGDDPATSTLAATMIVQQGKIPQSWAPYFPEQSSFTYPPGYPSVIAFLYLLDPLLPMPVLVSLFSVFFAVTHGQIFVLTRRVSDDHRAALCSAAFSALLSIGFYQMINNGRFPELVGLVLTLNLLLFSYLYSITGKRKLLLLAGITLASLFVTYSISFITATLFVILFFSFELIFYQYRKKSVFGVATIIIMGIVVSLPWVFNIFNRLMVEVPTREYEALLVWFNMYSLRGEIGFTNLFMYCGYWLFLFGIIGLLIILVRRRSGSFLLSWFLSIFFLMLNEIFKIHLPGWYYLQSGVFLNPTLSLPLSVLAGIGFVKAYDFLKKRLQNYSRKLMKTNMHFVLIAALLSFTVILGATIITFWNPEINNDLRTLQIDRISTADYNAIMWISNNTLEDAVIFNDHWVGTPSIWIPVMSHRRIIMPLLSISEVGWTNIMFTRQDESFIVARDPNSTEALSILKKYDVSYIYLSNRVSDQVEEWRNNYDAYLFLQSPHYKLAFNEDNAWVIRVIY
jgi:hypothetical protein